MRATTLLRLKSVREDNSKVVILLIKT